MISAGLTGMVDRHDLAKAQFDAICDRLRLERDQFSFIKQSPVHAVLVFDHQLIALNEQPGMLAAHSTIMSTMGIEINLGENTTHRVFSPNHGFGLTRGDRDRGTTGLYNQAAREVGCRRYRRGDRQGGRRWSLHRRGRGVSRWGSLNLP